MGIGSVISEIVRAKQQVTTFSTSSNNNRRTKQQDYVLVPSQVEQMERIERIQKIAKLNYLKFQEHQQEQPKAEHTASATSTNASASASIHIQQVAKLRIQKDQPTTTSSATSSATKLGTTTDNNKTIFLNKKHTVSLVTSFFATPGDKQQHHSHIAEIEIAILNNLHNPHFQQVVVILDSATQQSNCTHFQLKMAHLQERYIRWGRGHHYWDPLQRPPDIYEPSKLHCVHRIQGQPSYYEMFHYATNPAIVTSDVVIVANADQAFDDTAKWAQQLDDNALVTLSTHGFNLSLAPASISQHYGFDHSYEWLEKKSKWVHSRCVFPVDSWDGYAFHRKLLEGKLSPHHFARVILPQAARQQQQPQSSSHRHRIVHPTRQDDIPKFKPDQQFTPIVVDEEGDDDTISSDTDLNNQLPAMALFHMNEDAAEYTALWALLQAVPNAYDASACSFIKTWHFHGTEKMHALASQNKPFFWDWSFHQRKHYRFDMVPPPYHFARYPFENAFQGDIGMPKKSYLGPRFKAQCWGNRTTWERFDEFVTTRRQCAK